MIISFILYVISAESKDRHLVAVVQSDIRDFHSHFSLLSSFCLRKHGTIKGLVSTVTEQSEDFYFMFMLKVKLLLYTYYQFVSIRNSEEVLDDLTIYSLV